MGSGCVNQSFAGGLAVVLKDYYIFVSQLERQHRIGQLTLQKVNLKLAIFSCQAIF